MGGKWPRSHFSACLSPRPLIVEVQVRVQASPWGICSELSDTRQDIRRVLALPVSLHEYLHTHILPIRHPNNQQRR